MFSDIIAKFMKMRMKISGSVIVMIAGLYLKYKLKVKAFNDFTKEHLMTAQENCKRAKLYVEAPDKLKQEQELKRIKVLLTNLTWDLNRHIEEAIKKSKGSVVDGRVLMYIMGDPGIGKSAAFSALIAGLNHTNNNVREEFRKMLPVLKDYEHFYYIDGSKLKKKDLSSKLL